MAYLVDAHALCPRHMEREQDFMCTSTLNNLLSKSVLGKTPDEIGDEPSDVENFKTDGNMLSTFASAREASTRPVHAPGVNGNIWRTPASAQQVSTRPVHAPPGIHPPGAHAVETQPRPHPWKGPGHVLGGGKYPKPGLNENITCLLALPDGRLIVSDPHKIKVSQTSVDELIYTNEYKWFTILDLQSTCNEKIIREVSVSGSIGKSIRLETMNVGMIQPPSLAPLVITEIEDPTEQVRVGDLISEVRGQSVLGKTPADIIRLINASSYQNTFTMKISNAVEVVVPMFKSLFVYSDNSVVVVDGNKLSIRPTWSATITPLAGHHSAGYVNGKAEDARFDNPRGVIVNPYNGDIIVADSGNNAIRLVKRDGTVTTLAGAPPGVGLLEIGGMETPPGSPPAARGLTARQPVARKSARKPETRGFRDGIGPLSRDKTGSLARFNNPTHLAWDNNESIVVVDAGNHSVRRVTMQGVVSTVAGGGFKNGINMGESGEADGEGIEARFNNPGSVVVDADGIIVVADTNNNRLCKIDGSKVTTVVNDNERRFRFGHDAKQVPIFSPYEMTLDHKGDILIEGRPGTSCICVVEMKLCDKMKEPAWFKMYWTSMTMRLSLSARHPMFSHLSPENLSKIMENILRTSLNYHFVKQSAEDTTMCDRTTRNLLAFIVNRSKYKRLGKERRVNEDFQNAILYMAVEAQAAREAKRERHVKERERLEKERERLEKSSSCSRRSARKGGVGAAFPGR